MRPTALRTLLALPLAALLVSSAEARPYKWQRGEPTDPYEEGWAPAPGPYGGGFIEMLMSGRDPTPVGRPYPGTYRSAPYEPYDPLFNDPPPVRRSGRAALPPSYEFEPEMEGLGMAVDPRYQRQVVAFGGRYAPGTIIIDTPNKFLYLVQPGGTAIRYGIGVGRPGFTWSGVKTVSMKREWPDWRPPAEMLKRRPDLPRWMPGGPENPLGARALYLGSSLYRIHGTNEPHTIGHNVSSGCIRMMNEDVVDLYGRVRVGTKVVVI